MNGESGFDADNMLFESRCRAVGVARGQEVEQEATDDGNAEPRFGAGRVLGEPGLAEHVRHGPEPRVDDAVEKGSSVGSALKGLSVHLEEQPLVGREGRVAQPAPELAGDIAQRVARRYDEVGERCSLTGFHGSDDRDEEPVPRRVDRGRAADLL